MQSRHDRTSLLDSGLSRPKSAVCEQACCTVHSSCMSLTGPANPGEPARVLQAASSHFQTVSGTSNNPCRVMLLQMGLHVFFSHSHWLGCFARSAGPGLGYKLNAHLLYAQMHTQYAAGIELTGLNMWSLRPGLYVTCRVTRIYVRMSGSCSCLAWSTPCSTTTAPQQSGLCPSLAMLSFPCPQIQVLFRCYSQDQSPVLVRETTVCSILEQGSKRLLKLKGWTLLGP